MHTEMWEHPATQANVATLRSRGAVVIEPAEGRLTGADTGKGRLPDPGEIFALATDLLARGGEHGGATVQDLAGRRVVVSAGGTREYLDPVRFLGNRSSGLQGYALARTAAARGAEVTLVAANVTPARPRRRQGRPGRDHRPAPGARRSRRPRCRRRRGDGGGARPTSARSSVAAAKIKKSDDGSSPEIRLTQNPDILAGLARERPNDHIVVVGFAAETGDDTGSVMEHAQAKLARKGCDLLVVNDVGGGAVFGSEDNEAVVLAADGSAVSVPLGSKAALAHVIWDRVAGLLAADGTADTH